MGKMRRIFLILAGVCLMAGTSMGDMRVGELRCEYLQNPQYVEAAQPRLSWEIQSRARGTMQIAYQVLVGSSESQLAQDQGDLWDSGRVTSGLSVHVAYAGKPLESRQRCFWKVRVWDALGDASPWSESAEWVMGLLKAEDWAGQWIGCDWMPDNAGPLPMFRKEFTIDAAPNRAIAYVSALGYYELYVNGHKIGDDVLRPAVSDYSKRGLYLAHDVTQYLKPGVNCIGLWIGRGWSTKMLEPASKEGPMVKAQLELDGKAAVATNDSWQMHKSCITPLGKGSSGDYGGELYDARQEIDGWCNAGLKADEWMPAKIKTPPTPVVSAQLCETNQILDRIRPASIEQYQEGYIVDMGKNYSGWLELRMPKLEPGKEIKISYADKRFPNGKYQMYNQRDQYIARGGGREAFCSRFNYHAFRYALIEGLPRAPKKSDITGMPISTGYSPATTFECSNPLLTDIYRTANWTYRCLSLGGYTVDCPHRERLGYGGDSGTSMEGAMTNFQLGAFFTKWSGDWRDSQNAEGDVPYVAPFPHTAGGGPAWSGFCITMPWQVYIQYGDKRILEQNYPTMQRWLAFIDTKVHDGILDHYVGIGNDISEWSFLGDWVPPGRKQGKDRVDEKSTHFFNNCYWLYCLELTSKVATLVGKSEEAKAYEAKATALAAKIHEKFLNPNEATYVNREQPYLAMPLLFGVTPPDLRPQVMTNLEKDIVETKKGHLNTGMHGTYFMTKYFIQQGRNDLIYTIASKDTFPSWGYMLKQGATTIWEEWDGDNSQIHDTLISIGMWFAEGLGGIQADEKSPGFKHFYVRPGFVNELNSVNCSQKTMYGTIVSNWERKRGGIELRLTVPPNSSATVMLPAAGFDAVSESGKPVKGRSDITGVVSAHGIVKCDVDAGTYKFKIR
jgi:alpha-L-rhamnosidase